MPKRHSSEIAEYLDMVENGVYPDESFLDEPTRLTTFEHEALIDELDII